MGCKINGVIRWKSDGFFFITGEDKRDYFVSRRTCNNYIRRHWKQIVIPGKKVMFIPKVSGKTRPNAVEVEFVEKRWKDGASVYY